MSHLTTLTASTHPTLFYADTATSLGTGGVQGTTAIAATTINIICTATTLDAANLPPSFANPLRGIRFNPIPGTQE